MSYKNLITTLDAQCISAGLARDGHATARVDVCLAILDQMARDCGDLDSERFLTISTARDYTRRTRAFCVIHDAAHRGDLSPSEYGPALAAERNARGREAVDVLNKSVAVSPGKQNGGGD